MMEYLPFGNLASRKKFKLPGAIEILRQCLQGLQYLHSRNIVHRDIKPDNIVLKSEFPIQVKLVDFGLATECTYNVQAAGTIVYLAPEVLAGSPYTCSVDIWALGLTALGLRNAFPLQEAINYNANRTPQQLSWYLTAIQRAIQTQVPPVAKLLLGMLAHQPQQRWNATYCLQQIEAVKHFLVSPAQAPPVTWGVPGQPGANGWQFQGQQNVILVPSQGASWGQRGLVRANSTSGRRKISLSNPGRINWNDPAPFM